MKNVFVVTAMAALVIPLAGCSINTKMVTRERVDQDLNSSAGNRGYLAGSAPAVGERKGTKTYIEVQVEAPSIEKENRVPKKSEGAPAPATNFGASTANQRVSPEVQLIETKEEFTNYTVQKGDTLQKISMKLFGTTKKWKKIFDANKEMLESPDKVRPDMILKIPKIENAPVKEKESEFIK